MKDIDNENLLLKALGEGCNLFLGAGFSLHAKNHDGEELPLGATLKADLIKKFGRNDLTALDLPKIASVLKATAGEEFSRYLIQKYSVGSFSDDYKALNQISIENIFTTNIDDLPFKIFEDSDHSYLNDV